MFYFKVLFFFSAYNEKVVIFLRQLNVDELLRDRCPQYASSSSLREKISKISSRGVDMLERYSNDIDLTLLLRYFQCYADCLSF